MAQSIQYVLRGFIDALICFSQSMMDWRFCLMWGASVLAIIAILAAIISTCQARTRGYAPRPKDYREFAVEYILFMVIVVLMSCWLYYRQTLSGLFLGHPLDGFVALMYVLTLSVLWKRIKDTFKAMRNKLPRDSYMLSGEPDAEYDDNNNYQSPQD